MMQRILVWWEKKVGVGRNGDIKRARGDNQHDTEERVDRKIEIIQSQDENIDQIDREGD